MRRQVGSVRMGFSRLYTSQSSRECSPKWSLGRERYIQPASDRNSLGCVSCTVRCWPAENIYTSRAFCRSQLTKRPRAPPPPRPLSARAASSSLRGGLGRALRWTPNPQACSKARDDHSRARPKQGRSRRRCAAAAPGACRHSNAGRPASRCGTAWRPQRRQRRRRQWRWQRAPAVPDHHGGGRGARPAGGRARPRHTQRRRRQCR